MNKTMKGWLGPVLAVAGFFIGVLLPALLGPGLYRAWPDLDWRDTGVASISLYGGSLLLGLALELYLLIRSIIALKRGNTEGKGARIVTLVLSGAGTFLFCTPIFMVLIGSFLPH
jgi:hypothetical protein